VSQLFLVVIPYTASCSLSSTLLSFVGFHKVTPRCIHPGCQINPLPKKKDQMPTANKIESPNQKTLGVADVEFCIMCVHIYVYTYVYMFFNICTHHGTTKHKCKMLIFRSIRRYLHFCAFWMVYIYICVLYIYNVYYICICIYSYMHTHGFLQKCGP
jgi:hypothetical protein